MILDGIRIIAGSVELSIKMAGLNLRSLRVDATEAFHVPAVRLVEGNQAPVVPALAPFNCGNWRPGAGVIDPIRSNTIEDMSHVPAFRPMHYEVDPVPARSV